MNVVNRADAPSFVSIEAFCRGNPENSFTVASALADAIIWCKQRGVDALELGNGRVLDVSLFISDMRAAFASGPLKSKAAE